jgi:ATP-dependent Clp protease ATP-binding subunit ClpX
MTKLSGSDTKSTLYCSFCGKSQHEVRKLIAGPTVFICDECVSCATTSSVRKPRRDRREEGRRRSDAARHLRDAERLRDRQDRAKRVLSVAVHNHYKRLKHSGKGGDVELSKSNILLVGPTGSGKTLLAQTLAKTFDVPFTMADATTLTEAGYVGEDVENIILKLLAGQRLQRREGAARDRLHRRDRQDQPQGRKPLDHARRVGRRGAAGAAQADGRHHGQRSAAGRAQASAAGIPAGGHDQHPVHLRRRFPGLERSSPTACRSVRSVSAPMSPTPTSAVGELLQKAEPEDLLKFGLIPEFVGRLPVIATLNDLDIDALVQILREPKNALVKQYQAVRAGGRAS